MFALIPLHHLAPGQSAIIRELMGKPDDVKRLEELGLRTGECVEMVDSGAPCIIRVAGSKLCFRGAEAFQILVAPQAGS
jgi:Fe2+ transport system protein FeoA